MICFCKELFIFILVIICRWLIFRSNNTLSIPRCMSSTNLCVRLLSTPVWTLLQHQPRRVTTGANLRPSLLCICSYPLYAPYYQRTMCISPIRLSTILINNLTRSRFSSSSFLCFSPLRKKMYLSSFFVSLF